MRLARAFLWITALTMAGFGLAFPASSGGMTMLAGFGAARLLGILVAGSTEPILYLFLGLELVGVVLCGWGARRVAEPERAR